MYDESQNGLNEKRIHFERDMDQSEMCILYLDELDGSFYPVEYSPKS